MEEPTHTLIETSTDPSPSPSALLFFPSKQFSSRYGEQFFTVQVDDFKMAQSDKGAWVNFLLCLPTKQYVTYSITVRCGKHTWKVERRFSEFAGVFGQESGFPKKTLFPVFSETFLATRQEQLNEFLSQHLERVSKSSGDLSNNHKVLEFFSFTQHEHEPSASAVRTAPIVASNAPFTSVLEDEEAVDINDKDNITQDGSSDEVIAGEPELRVKYDQMLEEVAKLRSKREELLFALQEEEASHALRKKTVEDLQTRLDEEIVSYTHAKAFIEDLQIRLEEVLMARAIDREAIDDLQLRLDEVVSAHESQGEEDILSRRFSDLQARFDEESVSYEHAKAFIEDLQNRIDDVLSSIESLKLQETELHSKVESTLRSNAELKDNLEGIQDQGPETTANAEAQPISDSSDSAEAEIEDTAAENASPVSKDTDARPSSVSSPTNVDGIHLDSEPVVTKPIDNKVLEGESPAKKTRRNSKKKRN